MQQEINSLLNPSSPASTSSQIPFSHMQTPTHHFQDPTSSTTDDFLEQMLFTIQSSTWSDLPDNSPASHPPLNDSTNILNNHNVDGGLPPGLSGFDVSALLASKLQQHQISSGPLGSRVPQTGTLLDGSHFKSLPTGCDESMQALHNALASGSQHHFFLPQPQNFEVLNHQQAPLLQPQPQPHPHPQPQPQASGSSSGGTAPAQQTKPRVRARRGQATDPHSIAERLRRERIAERMKSLQELVPNANKTDKASMLDEIIDYVKFLQLQVKVLSMSRLGGAAAVAPLVADMSSEGGSIAGECCQPNGTNGRSATQTPPPGENITVTEHHVAKLMEEDMGSAMQFLQGKGLCLMPISLATAISTATCQTRTSPLSIGGNGRPPRQSDAENSQANADGSSKDAASISKP